MIPVALQVLWRFAAGSRRWRMPVLLTEAYHVSWALEPLCAARLWLVLQLCVHTHPCDAESGVWGREHHSVVPHRKKRLRGAAAQEVLAFCSAPECTGARFAISDRSVRSAQGLGACFSKQKVLALRNAENNKDSRTITKNILSFTRSHSHAHVHIHSFTHTAVGLAARSQVVVW